MRLRPLAAALAMMLALAACSAQPADLQERYVVIRGLQPAADGPVDPVTGGHGDAAGTSADPGPDQVGSSTGSSLAESAGEDRGAASATAGGATAGGATAGGASGGGTSTPGGAGGSEVAPRGADSAGSSPQEMGPGVTDTEIRVGFQVTTDMQAAFTAVGAGGRPPDERATVEALVRWVNGQGGIAGRELVPIFHETNPLSGSFASQAQAACATFAEDNEVMAVGTSPVGGSDAMVACLSRRGTPVVEQNHWWFDGAASQRYAGWLYQPAKMQAERGVRAYADGLAEAGFFEGGTVGLIRFDAPVFTRMTEQVLKPRLAAAGVSLAEEVAVSTPGGVGEFGRMSGEINNAILRFRSAGVNRLMILENSAIMSFFLMPQAESQGYRPRYGISTYNTPTTIANQAPVEQLRGTVGIGWAPSNDVYDAQHPGGNPTWDRCMDIFREAGLTSDYAAQGYYLMAHCDTVMFLRAALGEAASLTPAGLQRAVQGLGTTYRSPFTLSTQLGPGNYAGARATRVFRYEEGCGCFNYS